MRKTYEYHWIDTRYLDTIDAELALLNEYGAMGWQVIDRDRGGFYFMREIVNVT